MPTLNLEELLCPIDRFEYDLIKRNSKPAFQTEKDSKETGSFLITDKESSEESPNKALFGIIQYTEEKKSTRYLATRGRCSQTNFKKIIAALKTTIDKPKSESLNKV